MTSTLITGASVWDGLADEAVAGVEILVEDGVITGLGSQLPRAEATVIVDLAGHTVTPGFIDCHTHLTLDPLRMQTVLTESPATKALRALPALRAVLMHGFTTVRDLACADPEYLTVDLKRAIDGGLIEGPRMLVAPHLLSATGGHGDASGMLEPSLAGSCSALNFPLMDGEDVILRAVRSEIARGADWIKFAATGGFSSPSDSPDQISFTQREINTLVSAAADLGVPVTPHCYGDEAARRCVEAGVRSIEHGNLLSAGTLELAAERGIYLVPTQGSVVLNARERDNDAYWAGKPIYKRRKYQQHGQEIIDCADRIAGSEVKIAFGTDIGMIPLDQGWREFVAMTDNGISPLRALKSATSVAAEMLDRPDLGAIEVGRAADIVAMPGDPFTDISVTGQVDFVMKAGVICT